MLSVVSTVSIDEINSVFSEFSIISIVFCSSFMLFVPYGFLLPWVFERARGFLRTGFWGLLTSVCVEVLQLISGRGYFQIDDILTNTLGALIGFLGFAVIRRIFTGKDKK